MTKRILLIDADVVAYEAASSVEQATDWGDGFWTWHTDENETRRACLDQIDKYMDTLKADEYKLCLTDSEGNFRFDVLPTYKGNRKSLKRPIILQHIKQWMIDDLGAYWRQGLEGDDCMGILATSKSVKGEKIIVSIDKDMKTIPGLFYRNEEAGLVEISQEEADRFHLTQTLAGDVTDGYDGCPGIGMERAAKALEAMTKLVPFEHTLSRGPRKGQTETRYEEVPTDDPWEVVVSRYQAAGLGETEALTQARVARILRASDYNFKTRKPKLWTPKSISKTP